MKLTGYNDRDGNPIREGDILEGWFGAPWDEQFPIKITFKVVRYGRRWLCQGIETNAEDDWLSEFKHLTRTQKTEG